MKTFGLAIAMALATSYGVDVMAAEAQAGNPTPVRIFAQVGVGLPEFVHAEVGGFLTPHLTIEAMIATDGVFGVRYGGSVMVGIGRAQGPRAPRHAFLLGARLMLNSEATFDEHGDDLSSYGVAPLGYAFLSDGGLYFRTTVGLLLTRARTTRDGPTPASPPIIEHSLGVAGPMIAISIGFACSTVALLHALE
jgi:hypothetical protein